MIKYIHYKDSLLASSAMISDKINEESMGYTLYIEFECDDFSPILKSVSEHLPDFKPLNVNENGVTNYSANVLKGHLISLLESDHTINTLPYRMKIHRNGKVMVYSRSQE